MNVITGVAAVQAEPVVLGQSGAGADACAGCGTSLCHLPGCILSVKHQAHGAAHWPRHSGTLPALHCHRAPEVTGLHCHSRTLCVQAFLL